MGDFFLYAKEIHSLVANARSKQSGRLCNVIFANDITGTRKPPDALFGKALTASSKSFEKLYPGLAGPTMILNLPFILQALVLSKLGELTILPPTRASARASST